MAHMINPPRKYLLPTPHNSCASRSFRPWLPNPCFFNLNLILPCLRGPYFFALTSLFRSFAGASRLPDAVLRQLGLGLWPPELCWRAPPQLPRMRTTTASSPSWQSLRVPRRRVQGLKTGLKRDAQGMQVQKLQVVQVPVAPQEHQVEEVLDVSTIASGAPSVSGAAAHGVFGIGEQNGDEQGSQVLPESQGDGGWIPLSPVDLPVARVGSAVNAQPDELRAVRKCLLAAARAA